MNRPLIVTAALPYANGSIHIGHLVEYVMTDVYVRALRLAGEDAYYICADDTHGTPIELNAAKAGVTPEEFVARYAKEHVADFTKFQIRFDSYHSTNSEENRRWVTEIYEKLKEKGHVQKKTIQQLYDEKAQRFLPDRFVKGTCPKCKSPDQYGDVCENCKTTYDPTDLIEPYSVVTNTKPVLKDSEHLYVGLSAFTGMLKEWSSAQGRLQPEIKNFVDSWIDGGLQDWCISRDAPYFGFEIPGENKKYFYVWIDAPVGYISSTENFEKISGRSGFANTVWRNGGADIHHIIGKDIIYFHTLFWPAMLHAAGLTVPSKVHVHGMLTVDGVKMSKSRGTFINAATYLSHLDSGYLRYYYASKTGPKPDDIDLALDDFVNKVNAELVNNLANLVSRGVPFIKNKLGGSYGELPAGAEVHVAKARELLKQAEAAYRRIDLASAVRIANEISAIGNKLFQDGEPWKTVKDSPEETLKLVTLCLNLARASTVLIAPVVPSYAETVYSMLGLEGTPKSFAEGAAFDLVNKPVGDTARIVERITRKQVDKIIEDSVVPDASKPKGEPAKKKSKGKGKKDTIEYDTFAALDLRVAKIESAELIEGSDKLLELTVDVGEEQPRTVLAGIRLAYAPEELVGRRVALLANLAPKKIGNFGTSHGMVLAAGPGKKDVWLLDVPDDAPIGSEIK